MTHREKQLRALCDWMIGNGVVVPGCEDDVRARFARILETPEPAAPVLSEEVRALHFRAIARAIGELAFEADQKAGMGFRGTADGLLKQVNAARRAMVALGDNTRLTSPAQPTQPAPSEDGCLIEHREQHSPECLIGAEVHEIFLQTKAETEEMGRKLDAAARARSKRKQPEPSKAEREAKERLGRWLVSGARGSKRHWDWYPPSEDTTRWGTVWTVKLTERGTDVGIADKPTLAEAIHAALDAAGAER